MPSPVDADKRDFLGIEALQFFGVAEWNEHVAGAMQDIGMAICPGNPLVGAKMEAQYKPDRQYR